MLAERHFRNEESYLKGNLKAIDWKNRVHSVVTIYEYTIIFESKHYIAAVSAKHLPTEMI